MSYRIDTNCSLCFNTAAGCISRHQLVQFHNRTGPRAQQGVRYTAWQHECHNSCFLPVQYFIWGQQFVPERDHKIEGELIFRRKKRRRKKTSARLLNSALFTPDSSMRKISSSKPKLLRSCTDTALSETLNGLFQMGTAECLFAERTIQSLRLQHCLVSETLHF